MCYKVAVHKRIHQVINVFYFMGLWQSKNRSWFHQIGIKVSHVFAYICLLISVVVGGYVTKDEYEASFLLGVSIAVIVLTIKLCYILWKKDEILDFIHHFGGHSFRDCEDYKEINDKIDGFLKYVYRFQLMLLSVQLGAIVLTLPMVTNKKTLPLIIYYPFVGTESEILYWITYAFMSYLIIQTFVITCFNGIIWYCMMCCAIKYQTLGNLFRKMGLRSDGHTTCKKEPHKNVYHKELIRLITSQRQLQQKTEQFRLCFSNLFFVQIATSSLGICIAVFALASIVSEMTVLVIHKLHETLQMFAFKVADQLSMFGSYIVLLVYMFDIFMVMFFGNEIKLSSNRLSYCLFESNWMQQSESSKKALIILMVNLQKPQQMIIRKLYPLDLRTFSSILNFAYTMFNILQNVK